MNTMAMTFKWGVWFLIFSSHTLCESTRTQIASKMCLEVDGNINEMTIIFRLLKKNDRVDTINAYTASEADPKESSIISHENCTINGTGVDGNPFEISVTINVNLANPDPECGIYKVSDNVFRLRVRSFEFEGFSSAKDAFYDCECDKTKMLPITEQIAGVLVVPSDDHVVILQPEKLIISFDVYNSEGIPVSTVSLGENVHLNMLFYSTNIPNSFDTCGTDFWIAFPELIESTSASVSRTILVYKKSSDEIKITVSNSTQQTTTPINTFFYPLSLELKDHVAEEKSNNKALRITSTEEICLIALYKSQDYRSTLTLHPADTLGKEYVLVGPAIDNMFIVIITENDTNLTIEGTTASLSVPSSITGLNQYESIQGWSSESVSGVRIIANKPVAVICGSKSNTSTPDPSFEQIPDITKLGLSFVFPPGPGDFTCVSTGTGTTIDYAGQSSSKNVGPFSKVTIPLSNDKFIEVKSVSPVLCVQNARYNETTYSFGMAVIPPIEQWSSLYSFAAYLNKQYKLSLVIKKGTENDLQINGKSGSIQGSSITWSAVLPVVGSESYVGAIYTTKAFSSPFFTISHPSETFLVVMEDIQNGRGVTVPPGFHLSHINQNGACTKTIGYPGDLVDNDCDGFVDEDINTNSDTGGNALDMRAESSGSPMAVRIRPISCTTKPNNNWDDGGITVDMISSDGCVIGSMGDPFAPKTAFQLLSTGTSYPQRYSTGAFEIHRFLGESKVFFRCKIQVCYSLSDTSCTTEICSPRTRRSGDTDGGIEKETSVSVQALTSNDTNTSTELNEKTCFERQAYIGTLCALFLPLIITLAVTIWLFHRFNTALKKDKIRREKKLKSKRDDYSRAW